MNKSFSSFIFVIIFSFSNPAWALIDDVNEKFCRDLLIVKKHELSFKKRVVLLKKLLKLKYWPRKFSKPVYHHIKSELIIDNRNVDVSQLRNIIFTVGPIPSAKRSYEQSEKDKKRHVELKNEIKSYNKIIKKLFKSKNLKSCLKKQAKYSFSYKEYIKILEERSRISVPGQIIEQKVIRKVIGKVKKKLKLYWEVKYFTHISEVSRFLARNDVANIIIVSHGKRNGHLVDSDFNSYPLSFFSYLSPSIFSINFFSCYSNETLLVYNMNKRLAISPSYFKRRFITTVKKKNGQEAPLKGFKSYLLAVDKKISKEIEWSMEKNQKKYTEKLCHIDIRGSKVYKGTLSLSLNRNFIGALDENFDKYYFSFPCRFINNKNTLVFKGVNLRENVSLDIEDQNIKLEGVQKKLSIKRFYRKDGTFRSIIVQF